MVWLALALTSLPAWAVYKVVGPDGQVSYSDRPPAQGAGQALKLTAGGLDAASWPYDLRLASGQFPVVLYTGRGCGDACDRGRELLKKRGVPFAEKTISTAADLQALQSLENTQQVPVLKVGRQRLQGFLDPDWTRTLDAAGYPTESKLPPGYAGPAPTALAGPAEPIAPPVATTPRGPATPEPARKALPQRTEPEPAVRF